MKRFVAALIILFLLIFYTPAIADTLDELVKVSEGDTEAGYLENKIMACNGIKQSKEIGCGYEILMLESGLETPYDVLTIVHEPDRTQSTQWSTVDIRNDTSNTVNTAYLNLWMQADYVGDGYSYIAVRKLNANTITAALLLDNVNVDVPQFEWCICGLHLGQFQYQIIVGQNWQVDSKIYLTGYID